VTIFIDYTLYMGLLIFSMWDRGVIESHALVGSRVVG
jgi:hypothetical protein